MDKPVLLPRSEVERRCGISRSTIYERMSHGLFPQAVRDLDSPSVWWIESEINAWIQARIDARSMGESMGRKSADKEKAA